MSDLSSSSNSEECSHIPIVDFARSLDISNKNKFDEELVQIFRTVGFVYIKNHGVDKDAIQHAFDVSRKFFSLPTEAKLKYARPPGTEANSGYVPSGMEKLNAFLDEEHKQREIREAYNFLPHDLTRVPHEVAEFQEALTDLFKASWAVTERILECLCCGMQLTDKNIFKKSHALVGTRGNPTTLRTLFYPPFIAESEEANKVTRCGTHSDYGTLTLLYQDQTGGLEVESRDDIFLPATPIPDCILVNVGDLLQRWTSDQLRSTRHRVRFNSPQTSSKTRQSMAFFVHPDDSYVVECLDNSGKYPPVAAGTYLQDRFKITY